MSTLKLYHGEEIEAECGRATACFVSNSRLSWVCWLLEMVQLVAVYQRLKIRGHFLFSERGALSSSWAKMLLDPCSQEMAMGLSESPAHVCHPHWPLPMLALTSTISRPQPQMRTQDTLRSSHNTFSDNDKHGARENTAWCFTACYSMHPNIFPRGGKITACPAYSLPRGFYVPNGENIINGTVSWRVAEM